MSLASSAVLMLWLMGVYHINHISHSQVVAQPEKNPPLSRLQGNPSLRCLCVCRQGNGYEGGTLVRKIPVETGGGRRTADVESTKTGGGADTVS